MSVKTAYLVTCVLVLGLAGPVSAAVIYSDSFDRPDSSDLGTNDNALGGIITALWVDAEVDATHHQIADGALIVGGGAGTNANSTIDHKFTAAELLTSFSVEFDVVPTPPDSHDRWFAIEFAATPASFTTGNNVNQTNMTFGFLMRPRESFIIWDGTLRVGLNDSHIIDNASGPARVRLQIDSPNGYSDGSSATARVYINDVLVEDLFGDDGTYTFTWQGHDDGLYISIEHHHATREGIDNLVVYDALGPDPAYLPATPSPKDACVDVQRNVVLTWQPGEFAVTHDVYFGASFDDVTTAAVEVLVGDSQDANSLDIGRLSFGTTYYWRVDEVNGAPDNTVFPGEVWSFTVEPFSIPIETIVATASSKKDETMAPENTVNGTGLDELDQHSMEPAEMWLSGEGDPTPWIQYEFDKAYKLDEMWVWNFNQVVEAFVGLGAKDVVIETSLNGVEWTILEDATQFAQAPGAVGYLANTMVDFGGTLAQYVKISINSGYGPMGKFGLSEVRFLHIPTFAREPQPADGEAVEGVDVVLTWRAGHEAVSHQVYLGTDAENLALVSASSDSRYAANGLNYGTTYYWQINEVNENETPAAYGGPIWSLTTPPFGTVDDFEQYDDDCERIFFVWEDGLGHNGGEELEDCDVTPSNGNGGGSIVGNASAPFVEKTIVYAGTQSMPLEYDNAFGPSEITRLIAGQDWTASGVQTLSLTFFGDPGNTGQLYAKIGGTTLLYDGDASNLGVSAWQAWNIDLSSVGGNLQNVTALAIGIDGANAAGKLYIDDIRLYPKMGETITPVMPDDSDPSLVAYYEFEGNADDTQGNYHGTAEGEPGYTAGKIGQAMTFDGTDDQVVHAFAQDEVWPAYSVGLWVRTDAFMQSDNNSPFNNNSNGSDFQIDVDGSDPGRYRYKGSVLVLLGPVVNEWVHLAASCDGLSTSVYYNGLLVDTVGITDSSFGQIAIGTNRGMNRPFIGTIDDVRIYDRALSAAEIAGLAGRKGLIHKPL